MRRTISIVIVALVLAAVSCRVTPAFLDGIEAGWEVIGPEYKAYLEADPTISDETKAIRLDTANGMDRLIAKEKARWK